VLIGLRGGVLVVATIAMGLMAGLFYAYACSVMIALGRADDRTFVDVMQKINVAILNGWFGLGFGGAAVLSAAAVGLHLPRDGHAALPWIVAGLVLYVAVLAVTFRVHIPLNDGLVAAGDPGRIPDLAAVRRHFEGTWVHWNVARAVLCTGALGCLGWALRVSGRA
jgi:uncharacterized membrane protein